MHYHWAISPLHTDSITSLQTRSGCLSTVTMFFVPSQVYSRERSMSFFSSRPKMIQGDTRVRTRDLSYCSRTLYHWAISPLHTDSITSLQTRSGCLSTVTTIFVPIQVFSRDRCHFSLSFKNYTRGHPGSNQGPLGLQPNALPLSYIPAAYRFNTITANTCRLFEHCYNVFCCKSSVLSRSMSFFLVFQKLYKGTPGFEPGTSRTAAECSTTELYPRCIQIQYHVCKHVQVVWALLQCFLFRVKCSLAIDVIFL